MVATAGSRWSATRALDRSTARRALAVFLALHRLAHLAGTSDVFSRSKPFFEATMTAADPST